MATVVLRMRDLGIPTTIISSTLQFSRTAGKAAGACI
jgi:hypothetical protein